MAGDDARRQVPGGEERPIDRAMRELETNPNAEKIPEDELPRGSERVFLRAPRPEPPTCATELPAGPQGSSARHEP